MNNTILKPNSERTLYDILHPPSMHHAHRKTAEIGIGTRIDLCDHMDIGFKCTSGIPSTNFIYTRVFLLILGGLTRD